MLKRYLEQGLSLPRIGRLVDRDSSTVGYWVSKHGLTANGREKHAPRGGVDEDVLEILCDEDASVEEMADELGRSASTVRYWLDQYGLRSQGGRRLAQRRAAKRAGVKKLRMDCRHHGVAWFVLKADGGWRCRKCSQAAVANWRRRAKRKLVEQAGGECRLCGYSRCQAALEFHHLDPSTKSFALSMRGCTRSIEKLREEASKCVLLCATCHAEVEAGFVSLGAVRRADGDVTTV